MSNFRELQMFLIRKFITLLLVVGVVEYSMVALLNAYVMPVMKEYILPEQMKGLSLGIGEVFLIFIFVVIVVVLAGVQALLPGQINGIIQWIEGGLEQGISSLIPSSAKLGVMEMDGGRRGLLMVSLFVMVFLLILPFVLGAFVYARIVTREFTKIEYEREEIQKDYARRRNLMLSDIAHDLRTPITTVTGYATALSDGLVKFEDQQEYLDAIRRKSVRMNDLITLLFDYVKLDSEGFTLDLESVEICELLRENAALIYSDMEDMGMEFEIEIPETSIQIQADRLQLSRVVTNLLTNAMKHNPKGTKIGISLVQEGNQLRIAVADTGSLIPEEQVENLFEPFAKGDRSRSSGGSGLGLSIARKVVQMHGWKLTLVQQPQMQKMSGMERYAKAFVIYVDLDYELTAGRNKI